MHTLMHTHTQSPSEELKVVIEQVAHQVSAENTELACAFIQKTAVEKAIPEMDKRLAEVGGGGGGGGGGGEVGSVVGISNVD